MSTQPGHLFVEVHSEYQLSISVLSLQFCSHRFFCSLDSCVVATFKALLEFIFVENGLLSFSLLESIDLADVSSCIIFIVYFVYDVIINIYSTSEYSGIIRNSAHRTMHFQCIHDFAVAVTK